MAEKNAGNLVNQIKAKLRAKAQTEVFATAYSKERKVRVMIGGKEVEIDREIAGVVRWLLSLPGVLPVRSGAREVPFVMFTSGEGGLRMVARMLVDWNRTHTKWTEDPSDPKKWHATFDKLTDTILLGVRPDITDHTDAAYALRFELLFSNLAALQDFTAWLYGKQ